MSKELKPCPFCGSKKTRKHENVWKMFTVVCDACGASIGNWYSEVQAENIWNARTERTCRIVPHGHLFTMSDGTELYESACSECGAYLGDEDNYCSICGAKVVE